jgi:hypothetical protein
MKKSFDITFMGHMCYDEIHPFQGEPATAPGSAVLCGAMAAARVGAKVCVVTRMSTEDDHILNPMRELGVECILIPVENTTRMRVVHPCEDVDVREMDQTANAGFMQVDDMPDVKSSFVHLAGITDREFNPELNRDLKTGDTAYPTDMQSFVRQVDVETRKISFDDVSDKAKITGLT